METRLKIEIQPQPDDVSCGPTCLHAVYRYYGDDPPLERVVGEIPQLEGGGTLAVLLGCHALRRGYEVTLYIYNLQVFDPTWFTPEAPHLAEKLCAQAEAKADDPKLRLSTEAYLDFLRLGGRVRMRDLNGHLIRQLPPAPGADPHRTFGYLPLPDAPRVRAELRPRRRPRLSRRPLRRPLRLRHEDPGRARRRPALAQPPGGRPLLRAGHGPRPLGDHARNRHL